MIVIDRSYATGYVRPISRGIWLGTDDSGDYLERIIEDELESVGAYTLSGGSSLVGVRIHIEIDEATKE